MSAFSTTPPTIAIGDTAKYLSPTSAVVYGTVADSLGSAIIDLSDGTTDDGTQAAQSGFWAFNVNLSAGTHTFHAVATDVAGAQAAADSSFTLVTGITGKNYVYQETDHDASGAVTAVTNYASNGVQVDQIQYDDNGAFTSHDHYASSGALLTETLRNRDGTHAVSSAASGQVLHSVHDDLMTGGGSNTHYVFSPHFGRDEITDFTARGPSHDIIDLPASDFANGAAVLHHTTTALDGSAVIHVGQSSIKLDGVSKAALVLHPQDVLLHA